MRRVSFSRQDATSCRFGRESARRRTPQAAERELILTATRRVAQGLTSLYGDAGISMFAERYLQGRTFADLRVPVFTVAMSLTSGALRAFSSGPLAPAVMASSAIPGVFPAVAIQDEVYVDGGTIDNVNVDVALDAGARRLFVLDIGDVQRPRQGTYVDASRTRPPRSSQRPFSTGPHPLALLMERALQAGGNYRVQRALAHVPACGQPQLASPRVRRHARRLYRGSVISSHDGDSFA